MTFFGLGFWVFCVKRSHLKQASVGVEAAGIQDAVFPLVKLGQLLLQIFVNVLQWNE